MPAAPRLAALLLGPLMVIGLLLGLASPAGAQSGPVFPERVGIGFAPGEGYIDLYFRVGVATDNIVFPEATGGTGTPRYELDLAHSLAGGNAPLGFSFDPLSRIFKGIPEFAGAGSLNPGNPGLGEGFEFTYRATDTAGRHAAITVYVTVCEGSGSSNGASSCSPPAFSSLAVTGLVARSYTVDREVDLTLPEATGGTGSSPTLLYWLTRFPSLPAGLSFNADTRVLSGTPTKVEESTIFYNVQDAASELQLSKSFKLTVNAAVELTAPPAQSYTVNTEVDVTLPEATGGTAPLIYTLTDPPADLSFDPNDRKLTGSPTAMTSATTLTYTVTDASGAMDTADFTVTVNAGVTLTEPTPPPAQSYTADTLITPLVLSAASGGTAPLTYTLTGPAGAALPDGLTFTAGSRTLSGTPSAVTSATTLTLTYTVTDDNGATASQTFMVTVNADVALSAPGAQGYTVNTVITDLILPEVTGGTGDLTYTLTGPGGVALPDGLTFTAGSRTLSGTPGMADVTVLTYTVTDANGAMATVDFTVTVNTGLALTAPPAQSYTAGTLITPLALSAATGGTGDLTYTLTGPGDTALPAGLAFDADRRMLSGTPDTADVTVLTYTVSDANGASTSQTFTVTVNDGLALNAPPAQSYTVDTAVDVTLPEATGGTAPLIYTLTNPPPDLSFDGGSRKLTGTPTAMTSATTLTYTVTDASGAMATADFTVTVNADVTLAVLTPPPAQSYTAGTLITPPLVLSAVTGGTAPLTYTLTGPGGGPLPDGLDFTAGTRTLSGTPTAEASTELTYTVSDANGASTSQTFMVTVNDGVTLTTPQHDQSYHTVDMPITPLLLSAAIGGTGDLTYTLTGPEGAALPAGLTFTAGSRTLSGTPSMVASTELTYTVTDANGAAATQKFIVTVAALPPVTFPTQVGIGAAPTQDHIDLYFELGVATDNIVFPPATGGTGDLTYSLHGPYASLGFSFDPDTRIFSGTPTLAGAGRTKTGGFELVYSVDDEGGGSDDINFFYTVCEGSANPNGASDCVPPPFAALGLVADLDDQSYTVDTTITALTLPAATGGTGTNPLYLYTLRDVPDGLRFNAATRVLSGTPTTVAESILTYGVIDAASREEFYGQFKLTVALTRFADLNRTILPEVARAIAGHTVGAIARRVTQARADGGTDSAGSFNLGGQTTVAGALASHGQAMADGTLSLKDLLGGGDFVLPLNARAAAGAPGLSSVAFWGAGDYSNLDGSGGAVDWDGDLFSAHLGADARLRDDLLVGLAVSWSRVDLDYSIPDRSGDYELDLTSFHPYVGWSALSGKLDLWATVGYGWGDLEIADETQQASSDVEMRTVAVGGLGRLLKVGATTLRLKGDALLTEMEVEGSDEMAGLTVDARRVRMILEGSRTHTLADGAQLEPSLEVGVRHDGGDGETGFGAELGGGVRYSNPVMGLTLEGRARTLVGRDSYGEWGVNGLIRLERGNGRGLSFNLSPGYGKTGSGTQRLWQQGLHDKIDGERDYGARMDLRLGYGLPAFGGRGLLTPYSELTFGDSARNYRLGMEWELGALFELNLTGERHESSDGAADHAIMLKGEVRF